MVMRTRPNYVKMSYGFGVDQWPYFVRQHEQAVGDMERIAAKLAFDFGRIVCIDWAIAEPIWIGIPKYVNEKCRVCQGTGANPLSDNVNFLPCAECRGTGTAPVRVNGL